MKRKIAAVLLTMLMVACAKVPITNRKQMNLLPESQLIGMSLSGYKEFLDKNPPVSTNDANAALVAKVGSKISSAVNRFMTQNKMADRVKGFKWEFKLVNSKEVNAWCMPGGKVVVYSGLLPVTKDEVGLAFVMGHEIAHAVARHGNERMSQMLLAQTGAVALDVALSNKPDETRAIFNTAYGVGVQVGAMLPFSRLHETEADKLGMVFMAMAGYDPAEAPKVWQRMIDMNKGPKTPEFLSTHPGDKTRIENLRAYVPTAKKYFKKS
ncbi:MAG: M48 family metallopeptidase [Bacteroidota bacterium]